MDNNTHKQRKSIGLRDRMGRMIGSSDYGVRVQTCAGRTVTLPREETVTVWQDRWIEVPAWALFPRDVVVLSEERALAGAP